MRLIASAGTLLGLCLCAVGARCQSSPMPLQAELVKQLEVKRLASGSTIRARVTVDWNGTDCVLRRGAILEATVEAVERRNDSTPSTIALGFRRAQCNGKDLTTMNMVVVALAQAPEHLEATPGVQFNSPAGPFPVGNEGSAVGAPPLSPLNTPRLQVSTKEHRFPAKAEIHNGDVLDIKGLKLSVGTGPNHSSVMTAERGDITLKQYTQMLLIPESLMFGPRPETPAPSAPSQLQGAPAAEPPPATPPSGASSLARPQERYRNINDLSLAYVARG